MKVMVTCDPILREFVIQGRTQYDKSDSTNQKERNGCLLPWWLSEESGGYTHHHHHSPTHTYTIPIAVQCQDFKLFYPEVKTLTVLLQVH